MIQKELGEFKWNDPKATCAHSYTVPVRLRILPNRPKLRIIDLGCGNGFISGLLADQGHDVVGVDGSETGVRLASSSFPKANFLRASLYDDLAKKVGNDFDVALSLDVIEHLYSPVTFLHAANLLLKRGGSLILSTPFHGYLKNAVMAMSGRLDAHFTANWEGGHIKFFSVRTLSEVVQKSGFRDLKFEFAGRMPFLWKTMILSCHK